MMEKTRIKIGIMAICAIALSYMALSPVIASIAAAFPGVNETLPQMVITLPSFMFIASSPLCGIAMGHINKKVIVQGALTCYLVGGLFPFFFHSSIWLLLAGSAIIGLGTGFLMPIINGYIVQYFEQEERAQLMGLNATFTALGALAFIFIGGQLSRLGWRYTYLVFLLSLAIIMVVVVCLPTGEPQKAENSNDNDSSSAFEMNPYILGLFVIGIIYFVIQNAFNTNSSTYVVEILGQGTAMASLITMLNTLGGIVGGATFKGLSSKCGNQIETVTLGIVAAGFFVAVLIPNAMALIVGSLMVGYGFAIFNAAGAYLLSINTKPETNAFTVSIYLACINLAAAVSPIVVNKCSSLIGHGTSIRFLFAGIVLALTTAASWSLNIAKE